MPNVMMTCDLCGKSHNYTKTNTYFIKFPGQHEVFILRECDYCQHNTAETLGSSPVSSKAYFVYVAMFFCLSYLIFLANSLF